MSNTKLGVVLPREHGAWAMFAAPVLVGIGAAETVNGAVVLFALTALLFFLLRYPLMLVVKSRAPQARRNALRWSVIYAALTGLLGMALVLATQLWLLIPITALGLLSLAFYLWQAAHRAEMSTLGEWTGIAGLALGAPGAYLVATGRLNGLALALYLLNVVYFGGTVFYVKFKVREQPRLVKPSASWGERLWAGRVTLAYHALVTLAVALLAAVGLVPALVVVAFVLMMCKAIGGVIAAPAARINFQRLGLIELGATSLFALALLLAYH